MSTDDCESVRRFMDDEVAFNRHLGIRITRIEPGRVRMEMPFREHHVGDPLRGALHGGIVATILDACGGAVAWSLFSAEDRVSTLDLRVDYLHPGPLEPIACEGVSVKKGRHVVVVDMTVSAVADPERVVARGRGAYSVWFHDEP